MVTAVEQAGLALAAFPVMIELIDLYRRGFAPFRRWWRYKLELDSLRIFVDTQQALLRVSCTQLLSPVITDSTMLDELLSNPGGSAWSKPELANALEACFPRDTKDVYLTTIINLNKELKNLELSYLGAREIDATSFNDISVLERHLSKIKFCLYEGSRNELREMIMHNRQVIRDLSGPPPGPAWLGSVSDAVDVMPYKHVSDGLSLLYNALCRGLNCSCPVAHTAHLRLDYRKPISHAFQHIESGSDKFEVLFCPHPGGGFTAGTAWGWQVTTIQAVKSPAEDGGSQANLQRIDNLCAAFTVSQGTEDYCLDVDGSSHYIQRAPPLMQIQGVPKSISLAMILEAQPGSHDAELPSRLSRTDWFRLALVIASGILQLQSTPWLNNSWDSRDIDFVVSRACNDHHPWKQPYVSKVLSSRLSDRVASMGLGESSFNLIRNKTLFALGVLLIEIAYKKPLHHLSTAEERGHAPFTALETANRLALDLGRRVGLPYEHAVLRCIQCNFLPKTSNTDLTSVDLQRAVYTEVVKPLEETFRCNVTPHLM